MAASPATSVDTAAQRLPALDVQPRLAVRRGRRDIRYVPCRRLIDVVLPGAGDFYVFGERIALFLHYAGAGTNTAPRPFTSQERQSPNLPTR